MDHPSAPPLAPRGDRSAGDARETAPRYTPGPWTAHQGWADPWLNLDAEKYPDWCEVIGPPDDYLNISGHFGIANARLIAAAPDLLEAVRLFLHYDESEDQGDVQLMLDYAAAVHAAKAALRKALSDGSEARTGGED